MIVINAAQTRIRKLLMATSQRAFTASPRKDILGPRGSRLRWLPRTSSGSRASACLARSPNGKGGDVNLDQATPAHALGTTKKELRCRECGYLAIVTGRLPSCPMCQATAWDELDRTPPARPFAAAAHGSRV